MRNRRLKAFQSLLSFPCGRVKDLKTIVWTQYFHCVFGEMKTQTFANAFVLTGPKTSRQAGRGQAGGGGGGGCGQQSDGWMDGY